MTAISQSHKLNYTQLKNHRPSQQAVIFYLVLLLYAAVAFGFNGVVLVVGANGDVVKDFSANIGWAT